MNCLQKPSPSQSYQGGGYEMSGNDLQAMVLEAAGNALQRLYPQFYTADHEGWGKVMNGPKRRS